MKQFFPAADLIGAGDHLFLPAVVIRVKLVDIEAFTGTMAPRFFSTSSAINCSNSVARAIKRSSRCKYL